MNRFILEDLSDETIDVVLAMPPKTRVTYYEKLIKVFYPDIEKDSENWEELIENYNSSFYVEKMYRTNRFFNEKFTVIYTDTGLIRNIWADLFYADDDLITH